MGFFDFLTGKGGGLGKQVQAANNKYAQSADRYAAMERLRDDGSDEALAGLLRRFSWMYDKTIEDEQEKESVHDWLLTMATEADDGDDAEGKALATRKANVLRALEKSAASAESISWQLRALAHIGTPDEQWAVLEKVIAANDNEYVRDPSRKIQLIHFLGESFVDERAARALIQWLTDVDETVRFSAVEALVAQKSEEVAREPLIKLLLSADEESRRIKIRILDGLVELGWNTHGFKGEVEQAITTLAVAYSIDNKGRIKKAHK